MAEQAPASGSTAARSRRVDPVALVPGLLFVVLAGLAMASGSPAAARVAGAALSALVLLSGAVVLRAEARRRRR